jgi:hypothetical protein
MSDEVVDFPIEFFKKILEEMRKRREIDEEALRIAFNREKEFRGRNIRSISRCDLERPPE